MKAIAILYRQTWQKKQLVLKAYPFHIEILDGTTVLARHERAYGREQDRLDPLHYLPLLAQRPGAFEHSTPMRQWRQTWPTVYETLLAHLRAHTTGSTSSQGESRAIRGFIEILLLNRSYPAPFVEQAIADALQSGIVNRDGVLFCLNRLLDPTPQPPPLDLSGCPTLAAIACPKPTLHHYNQLLSGDVA